MRSAVSLMAAIYLELCVRSGKGGMGPGVRLYGCVSCWTWTRLKFFKISDLEIWRASCASAKLGTLARVYSLSK
jgi:hypothetical protein